MKKYVLFFLVFLPFIIQAQDGCTDPMASNFDNNASNNDGSCVYPSTTYTATTLATLPNALEETSGLAFFDGQLWTHNDAGGEDKIYQIDTLTGEIERTVIIATADNFDWEDLAESETHLYISDTGNNDGNRTNLRIYRISKADIAASNVVNADLITFNYADQTDFSTANNDNDYDCEALIFYNDSLHLFTKNWVTERTRHYVLPAVAGDYTLEVRDEFDAGGLITGAAISAEGVIALLGYQTTGINFMWLLFDYPAGELFGGNKRYISLGSAIGNSQTEGIVFRSNGQGFIGSEDFLQLPAKLLYFETAQWTTPVNTSIDTPFAAAAIPIYPNPTTGLVQLDVPKANSNIQLYNAVGELILSQKYATEGVQMLDLSALPSGIYMLQYRGAKAQRIVKWY